MTALPRVTVLATGGTIASVRDPRTGAVRTAATPADLIALVPSIGELARVEARPQASVNSWNMTPAMMLDLVRAARRELEQADVRGVVITHGTDTIEETALLSHIAIASAKPVVFVAAMRNLSDTSPDGPRNLYDAVRIAIGPDSVGRGTMVVLNETIHSARFVTKTHTVNPAAFSSPHGGPIGEVSASGVDFFGPPSPRLSVDPSRLDANVPLVKTYAGMDPGIFSWHLTQGIDGLVIEGSGAGNIPGEVLPGVREIVASCRPVVLTTRCIGGPLAPIYGTGGASGGGHDLMEAGLIPASRFTGQKARIALLALLGADKSRDAIQSWFRDS